MGAATKTTSSTQTIPIKTPDLTTGLNQQVTIFQISIDMVTQIITVLYQIQLLSPNGVIVQTGPTQSYTRYNQPQVLYPVGAVITPPVFYPVGTVVPPVLGPILTNGLLESGVIYELVTFVKGDDFTNVGGANVNGTIFTATGTTPTIWTNLSSIAPVTTLGFTANGTQIQTAAIISDGTQVQIPANPVFNNLQNSAVGQGIIQLLQSDLANYPNMLQTAQTQV